MELASGSKLGQYVIERRLGMGGMGEVYLAKDTALNRLVAVKTLLPQFADNEDLVRRFEIEAQAVAQLNHPNIVQIFQVDVKSDPIYMAMEYVDGIPLDMLVKQKGKLSWQQAFSIIGQVAAALSSTHEKGIIHRDIKPANILLDRNMGVHVTDFGIAKVLDRQTQLTATDAAIGSPCYMSPEHCGVGSIVPASDIFSLGVTLYEAMTGELPFQADTALGLMNQIATEPPAPITEYLPDLPPMVPAFLDVMMGKDLEHRYESASQIVEDLRAFRDGKTPTHLSAIRRKRSDGKGTIFEVVVPEKNMVAASKGQSLVSDLLVDTESSIPARVIIKPDSQLPSILGKGLAGIAGAVILIVLFWGIGNAMQQERPEPLPPPLRDTTPGLLLGLFNLHSTTSFISRRTVVDTPCRLIRMELPVCRIPTERRANGFLPDGVPQISAVPVVPVDRLRTEGRLRLRVEVSFGNHDLRIQINKGICVAYKLKDISVSRQITV